MNIRSRLHCDKILCVLFFSSNIIKCIFSFIICQLVDVFKWITVFLDVYTLVVYNYNSAYSYIILKIQLSRMCVRV